MHLVAVVVHSRCQDSPHVQETSGKESMQMIVFLVIQR